MGFVKKRKFFIISAISVVILFMSIFSIFRRRYIEIVYDDIFKTLSSKKFSKTRSNKFYYIEDLGSKYAIKHKESPSEEDYKINNAIIETFLNPLDIYDFIELRKRMELHTDLWHLVFGNYEPSEDMAKLENYRNNLIKKSTFLVYKDLNKLSSEKRLLAALHQSLYPWLYYHQFNSLKQLMQSYHGKGLVISTGNKHFNLARSTIDALRNIIHSKIPIEIIYYGDQDLTEDRREILKKYKDVYLTDISSFFDNSIIDLNGWAIKPYAILASRFEEVILIDADVMYLRDPIELFEDPDYKKVGTLFFRDRSLFPGTHPAEQWVKSWMIEPLPETKASRFWNQISQHEMESSTVVINKAKNILGLLSVCKLNQGSIRTGVVYQFVYGDKETFWMGFDMARQHYHMNSIPLTYLGNYNKEQSKICGHLGHMLPNGDIMFWNGHVVKEKKNIEGLNSLINFNSYFIDDDHGNWIDDLTCLDVTLTEKPKPLDEQTQKTLDSIIEREKKYRFVIPRPSSKKKKKKKKII